MRGTKLSVGQVIDMQSEEIDRLNDDLQRCREMISLLSNALSQYVSYDEVENIVKCSEKR